MNREEITFPARRPFPAAFLVLLVGALLRLRPTGRLALLWGFLWPWKAVAGALSPLMLGHGFVLAAGALRRGRRLHGLAALAGSALAAEYIARVAAPHGAFAAAFGPGWEATIPPRLRNRYRPRRWPALPSSGPPPRHLRDVACGTRPGGDPLLCDLWLPPAGIEPTGLGLIYLHGSAWHYLDKDMGTRPLLRPLARQGHVVMDVAYTLSPRATMREMVGDVKQAIAWLKQNGGAYGVHPERIVLAGGSAGGHLALLAAYTPNHPALEPAGLDADTAVAGVVASYGFADLVESHRYFNRANYWGGERVVARFNAFIRRYLQGLLRRIRFIPPYGEWVSPLAFVSAPLGGTPAERPRAYALCSPQTHAGAHCPPTLFLQGADDMGGMVPQIRRLHQTLRAAGADSVYVEFPRTEHGFDLFFPAISPAASAAFYDLERFLGLLLAGWAGKAAS